MTVGDRSLEQLLDMLLDDDTDRSSAAMAKLRRPWKAVRPDLVDRAANTAALLIARGQSDRACRMLELLHVPFDRHPTLLNNLAFAHMARGHNARALDLLQQAAALAPDDALIQANLSRARRRFELN